ncbi:MAG TPA: AraC family transcriptional regulator [Pseudomonadales bacterium]
MSRPRPAVERALAFIQDRLGDPMTVAHVAKAAALSEFHLHRLFHRTMGESVGRYITRKRLETAALRLACEPTAPITAIALDLGYSSSSNFSKAFKLYFGVSPTSVRRPSGEPPTELAKVLREYGHAFRPDDLFAVPFADGDARAREAALWQRRVRFEQRPAMTLACLASPDGYAYEALLATWNQLIDRCRALGVCGDDVDSWGVAFDSPDVAATGFHRYHACVRGRADIELPAPLFRNTVRAGRFAVFDYAGPVAGVAAAYRSIYSCWFPENSLAPGDYVPLDHYVGNEPQDGEVTMELWLRVGA